MRNAIRLDEIDGFLRDGGSIDEILIETEPSDHKRVWSKAGKEIEQSNDESHSWRFNRITGRYEI